jgi:hypothetical protein
VGSVVVVMRHADRSTAIAHAGVRGRIQADVDAMGKAFLVAQIKGTP